VKLAVSSAKREALKEGEYSCIFVVKGDDSSAVQLQTFKSHGRERGHEAVLEIRGHEAVSEKKGHEAFFGNKGHGAISEKKGHGAILSGLGPRRQTPEELGFTDDGDVEEGNYEVLRMTADYCLDLGAKGFPLPVFEMLQKVDWDASKYFEQIQSSGYAEDTLQMTGPQDAVMRSECMKGRGKLKHIFVGDSQMMSLRNAFHRLNRCPEIWWDSNITAARKNLQRIGRLHSSTQQAPVNTLYGCKEEGVASFIYWDAWAKKDLPVAELKREMDTLGLDPKEAGDTVVVWVGSNFINAASRTGALTDAIDRMHELGVKLVWDSPTFPDTAIMTAVSLRDEGRDGHSRVPITYTSIRARMAEGKLGSNMYKTEKALMKSGIEIPMTKRWQLTNHYRGLQCDGFHTDMRARDAAFYDTPCPRGEQSYGKSSNGCNWVESFNKAAVAEFCPAASGLDDLVLQSGLYSICAAHETPFCFQHTEHIR